MTIPSPASPSASDPRSASESHGEKSLASRVAVTEQGLAWIADSGERVEITPVRCFPLTQPDRYISLRNRQGEEVFLAPSLGEFSPEVRKRIEAELAAREFILEVLRIVRVSSIAEPNSWDVETDRGTARFTLQSEGDVRRVGPHRLLIVDTHGIRYLIPDSRKLDSYSKRIIERYT